MMIERLEGRIEDMQDQQRAMNDNQINVYPGAADRGQSSGRVPNRRSTLKKAGTDVNNANQGSVNWFDKKDYQNNNFSGLQQPQDQDDLDHSPFRG